MIPRIHIAEAGRHVGETVEIAGWLYNCAGQARSPSRFCAMGTARCSAWPSRAHLPEELFETIKNLTQESSIIVTGKIAPKRLAPRAVTKWISRICK